MEKTHIKVRFFKKCFLTDNVKEVRFLHPIDKNKTPHENDSDAFDCAVAMGHDPNKRIQMTWI